MKKKKRRLTAKDKKQNREAKEKINRILIASIFK